MGAVAISSTVEFKGDKQQPLVNRIPLEDITNSMSTVQEVKPLNNKRGLDITLKERQENDFSIGDNVEIGSGFHKCCTGKIIDCKAGKYKISVENHSLQCHSKNKLIGQTCTVEKKFLKTMKSVGFTSLDCGKENDSKPINRLEIQEQTDINTEINAAKSNNKVNFVDLF